MCHHIINCISFYSFQKNQYMGFFMEIYFRSKFEVGQSYTTKRFGIYNDYVTI